MSVMGHAALMLCLLGHFVPRTTASPLGCDESCIHREARVVLSLTCRIRIQWARDHAFAGTRDACKSAQEMVLEQCPSCADCTLAQMRCEPATTTSSPAENTTAQSPVRHSAHRNDPVPATTTAEATAEEFGLSDGDTKATTAEPVAEGWGPAAMRAATTTAEAAAEENRRPDAATTTAEPAAEGLNLGAMGAATPPSSTAAAFTSIAASASIAEPPASTTMLLSDSTMMGSTPSPASSAGSSSSLAIATTASPTTAATIPSTSPPSGSCSQYGCVGYDGTHSCQCDAACRGFDNCCADFVAMCPAAEQIVMKENVRRGPLRAARNPLGNAGIFLPVAFMCAAVVTLAPIIAVVRMSCRPGGCLPTHASGSMRLVEQYEQVPERPRGGNSPEAPSREVTENAELLPKRSDYFTRGGAEEAVLAPAEQRLDGSPLQHPSWEPAELSDVEGERVEERLARVRVTADA